MNKEARLSPTQLGKIWKMVQGAGKHKVTQNLVVPALASGAGTYTGYNFLPDFMGYGHDESAKRISGLLSGLSWPALASLALKRRIPLSTAVLGGIGQELVPLGISTARDLQKTIRRPLPPTISEQVSGAIQKYSPELRGAGIGTALAGIGALGTSSLRRKTDKEKQDKATRTDMVKSDFLKYLLPSLAAGGIGGHLLSKRDAG